MMGCFTGSWISLDKTLLTQIIPITKITQISTSELTLNWSRLLEGGRLMEEAFILPQEIQEELCKRNIC